MKKRGNSDTEIAKVLDRDRKTVRRALAEPADKQLERPKRGSLVDPYKDKILQWIQEGVPVKVMLERVKKDSQMPYQGGSSIFYQLRFIRQDNQMTKQKAIWRFEGLPGEYLQVDWGEKRNFSFTQIPRNTRYCFVGRLKYSRWIHTEFHTDMRYETLIRCILRCFESLGGVPWVLVFDNMTTVAERKKQKSRMESKVPTVRFRDGIPSGIVRQAANQKRTVESGVKFVKFFAQFITVCSII